MPSMLKFEDRFFRVDRSDIESETSDSLVFASIPDNVPTRLIAEWTGKQFTKLFSSVFQGAHLMFPEEAGEIIWQLLKVVHQPLSFSEDASGDCVALGMSSPLVIWSPQNPYNEPEMIPEGYLVPPFFVNSEFEYPEAFGYQASDIFLNPASLTVDPLDVLTLNFPKFEITVKGSGQIEIDLLNVASGGMLVYKIGTPPNIFDILEEGEVSEDTTIVDLNNDSVSAPPEKDTVVTEEINIEADPEEHTTVYFVFLPVVDDSLIPVRFGGGVRAFELCGFEEVTEMLGYIEDIRHDPEGSGFIQARVNGEWENKIDVADMVMQDVDPVVGSTLNLSDDVLTNAVFRMSGETSGGIANFSNFTEAIATAQTTADNAQTAADAAQTTADAAVSTNVTQAGLIAANTSAIGGHETRIDTLESEMNTAQLDIGILQADAFSHDGRLDSLETRVGKLDYGGAWAHLDDFTLSAGLWTPTFASWVSGAGFVATTTEAILTHANIFSNEITHMQIAIETSGSVAPVCELGWLGSYIGAIKWNGNGVPSYGWIRIPNNRFNDYMKFRVRVDNGGLIVKQVMFLGRGATNPLL